MEGADLQEASLNGTRLFRANLRYAKLMGASLVKANLEGANLWKANFADSNLDGVNLSGATLSDTNLLGVSGHCSDRRNVQIHFDTYLQSKWTIDHVRDWLDAGAFFVHSNHYPPDVRRLICTSD